MAFNPLDGLDILNADGDRRRTRRELTLDELGRLLAATRASEASFRGLDGEARFHLYACACGTGFRAGGLDSLTPECFDLGGASLSSCCPSEATRAARASCNPCPLTWPISCVPGWQASQRDSRSGPAPGPAIGRPPKCSALDLEAAGIPYTVQGGNGPEHADFHALRHTYLTLGGRAGIDLRTLQELAGHSTPLLTARYTHVRLHDQAGAVEKLPGFLPVAEPESDPPGNRNPAGTRPGEEARVA